VLTTESIGRHSRNQKNFIRRLRRFKELRKSFNANDAKGAKKIFSLKVGWGNASFQLASKDAYNLEGYATLRFANLYCIARTGAIMSSLS